MCKKSVLLLFAGVLLPFSVWADELTATLDNSKIAYGETVRLKLVYDGNNGGALQPDFNVLRQDYNIHSVSSAMNTSIINGVSSQKREWNVVLLPKNEGKQQIPSISAGKYQSAPIELEVLSADAVIKKSENSADVPENTAFFKAELNVENKQPYLEQEITAVLTISDNRGVQLNREPYFENADDWDIKILSRPETKQQNGKNITEFTYALSPQKSGSLSLPQAVIDGYYLSYNNTAPRAIDSDFFPFMDIDIMRMAGEAKPVLFKSKPETIEVKPIPEDYKGWWLPADIVVVSAEWADKNPTFKVGEAVSREITVAAAGIAENQLPELEFAEDGEWKKYPDKPQYSSAIHQNKVVSQEIIRVVYIPQKSGELKLPEIRIPWFNVKTQKAETAVIAAQTVMVAPNEAYENVPAPVNEKVQTQKDNAAPEIKVESTEQATAKKTDYPMLPAVLLAFLSGIIISFLLFGQKKEKTQKITAKTVAAEVKNALDGGDFRQARDALITWGEIIFPKEKINNLKELSDIIANDEFTVQCEIINACLYGLAKEKPNEKVIREVLKNASGKKNTKRQIPLPDLYK